MPDAQPTASQPTPRHLWVIGSLTLVWNAMGAFDFVMTQTRNEAYMGEFPQEQLDYFYSFPLWVNVSWGIAVFSSLVGILLLLARKRIAVLMFLVSLFGLVATTIYSYVLSEGLELMGAAGAVFTVVIFVWAVAIVLYSRAMTRRGVLR